LRQSSLKLEEHRFTAHVLEAVDPASAILEFARANHVDHILIGARHNSLLRKLRGSVSAKVAAEAHCTVTIARDARVEETQPVAVALRPD
jgi:nucleotide-binding universal stress UspA family protein